MDRKTGVWFAVLALSSGCTQQVEPTKSAVSLTAQPAKAEEQQVEAGTKMEALSERRGKTIVTGFSDIGVLKTPLGSVSVQAREHWDASNPKARVYGIKFGVRPIGTYERETFSVLDYDEIDPLLQGIDVISKADKSITSLDSFQVDYRSKGGLRLSTFSQAKGTVGAAISTSGGSAAYPNLNQLPNFTALVVNAKKVLDSARENAPK